MITDTAMTMKKKIDVHTHCLPGVDDGAKTVEESLQMLSDSFNQGVEICAATPHCVMHRQSDLEKFLKGREEGYKKLSQSLKGGEYPRVILGAEVYFDNDLNNYEGVERLCLEKTDYIMLEFPVNHVDPRWAEWIYNLNRKGIKVLIAHVDRYIEWERIMADFKGLDVAYQVNASRFLEFGSGKLIKKLIEHNHDYIISSDMHNIRSRSCNMQKAYEKAKKKYPDMVDAFFCLNAGKILGL